MNSIIMPYLHSETNTVVNWIIENKDWNSIFVSAVPTPGSVTHSQNPVACECGNPDRAVCREPACARDWAVRLRVSYSSDHTPQKG